MRQFISSVIWSNTIWTKGLIVSFLLILSGQALLADAEDSSATYFRVLDLKNQWQVYDNEYEAYVPYIQERHRQTNVSSVWVDLDTYRSYFLIFYAYQGTYLFINNELAKHIQKDTWVRINLDSLAKRSKKKKIFCTFYDKQYRLPFSEIFIGGNLDQAPENQGDVNENLAILEMFERKGEYPRYFTIAGFVALLSLYTWVLNSYSKSFSSFYSLRSSLSNMSRIDENLINKPLSVVNLVFLSKIALVIAFIYILIHLSAEGGVQLPGFAVQKNFMGALAYWFLAFLFFLSLGILKYILSSVFGALLNINKVTVHMHFFEYIRLSMIFYSTVIVFPVFIHVTQPFVLGTFIRYFTYLIVSFHIIQSFLVSFFVIQQTHDRSLYLFYYLCITELMPLLVGIKLLSN